MSERAAIHHSLADHLAQPATFSGEDVSAWSIWDVLRARAGLSWTREPEGPGFWSVVRHDDARRLLEDWRVFRSEPGTTLEGDRWRNDPAAGQMLPLMDPVQHEQVRGILAGEFTAKRLSLLVADTRDDVRRALGRACDAGWSDIDADFGRTLPTSVALALFGCAGVNSSEFARIVEDSLSRNEATRAPADAELLMFVEDLIARKQRQPGNDLVSRMVAPGALASMISADALLLTMLNLIEAGLTTTRLAINGAFEAFARHPAEWQKLRRSPQLVKPAIEEVLRWTAPALAVVRTCCEKTELAGTPISVGERLVAWLPSANRDEAVFHAPSSFMIDRKPNNHLGFGVGLHRCIGMALARKELELLLSLTAKYWDHLEVRGTPTRLNSLILQGIDHVELTIRPYGVQPAAG